jgi:hypothetical protein
MTGYAVELRQIPQVLGELPTGLSSPVFATFMFNAPDQPSSDNTLNIQFSVEKGMVGFDWVLLGDKNIRDERSYVDFARAAGYEPILEQLNGVKYWRVERGDLAQLCEDVITKLYNHPQDEPVEMVVYGFDWKPQ